MKPNNDEVLWGRTRIKYSYSYTQRKTLAINVHPNLKVSIVAPLGTELEDIRAKVLKRASWIRDAKRGFELYLPKQPDRRYIGGETHRYLGRQYKLKIGYDQNTNAVKWYRGSLRVTCSNPNFPAELIKEILQGWYKERSRKVIGEAMQNFAPKILGANADIPNFSVRQMKTRWGSCSSSGRLCFNLELVKAPLECIEYVVVHELCHLKEHNHSAKFWALVERSLFDYRERKSRLNYFADV